MSGKPIPLTVDGIDAKGPGFKTEKTSETPGGMDNLLTENLVLDAMLENTETHFAYLDTDFNFMRVNSAYARGAGYTKEELIGKNHFDLFPNDENRAIFQKARDNGERVEFREKPFVYENQPWRGTTYWDWTLTPIKDAAGRVKGLAFSLTDVTERKEAEEALRKREEELEKQTLLLEEVNTALRVLLKQREDDKKELEDQVVSNVKTLIMPYIEKMKGNRLEGIQEAYVGIIESNLINMVSPFVTRLSSKFLSLTPTEIQVADLIKQGRTNKQIAEMLNLSVNTIISHRFNLRTKLGMKNKKMNLRSYLQSLD